MLRSIRCFTRHGGGATAPEYGLVAAIFTETCHQISHQVVC